MKTRQLITLTGIVAFSGGVIFPTQAEELTETSRTSEDEMVITASGFSQQNAKRRPLFQLSIVTRWIFSRTVASVKPLKTFPASRSPTAAV